MAEFEKPQYADCDVIVAKRTDQAKMWDGFPVAGVPPFGVAGYFNDFQSWVSDEWTVTEVGTSLQKLNDEENGVLALISGGTEDNGNNCQLGGSGDDEALGESFLPEAGRTIWFEAKIKSNDVTQNDIFVGLAIQDTTVLASNPANMVGFITHDGDALLDFFHNGSIEESVHTLVDDTFVTVGFKLVGTDYCEAYVDGVKVATVTTDLPATAMKLTMAHLTGEGAANTLELDYIACYQTR